MLMREFLNGAEVIARAALDAGCNFFAGYPITPATQILLHMIQELPKVGGVAIQAEDEIASMGLCIGAVMAGSRAMTATSGPGISLYSENIGLGIMGEVPLVIVDVQRLGPATGGATTTAQGDIQFLRWGTSGGYPVIVLCPTDLPSCYTLTLRAFDLAERFRLPVILATDKETVLTSATVDRAEFEKPPVRQRVLAPAGDDFVPYRVKQLDEVPPMSPLGGTHLVRFTTSSHNEHGVMTKNPQEVGRLNLHLAAKVEEHLDEIAFVKENRQAGAETLLVSYGVTALAMDEAAETARLAGRKISTLTIYSLWPVPEAQICQALSGVKRLVVAELNLGQYLREIERLARAGQEVVGVQRVDGELISPEDILKQGGICD
jgi:2-oxoglutarate ferredoxin oxidoreductase subunit alpha